MRMKVAYSAAFASEEILDFWVRGRTIREALVDYAATRWLAGRPDEAERLWNVWSGKVFTVANGYVVFILVPEVSDASDHHQ